MRIKNRKGVAAVIILTAVFLPWLLADAANEKGLSGKAFTDPSYKVEMPKEWIEKPVKYENFAKDADIAIALEQDLYQAVIHIIQKYAKDNNLKIAVKEGALRHCSRDAEP